MCRSGRTRFRNLRAVVCVGRLRDPITVFATLALIVTKASASSTPTKSSTTPRVVPRNVVHDVDLVLDTVGGPDSRSFPASRSSVAALCSPCSPGDFDEEETAKLGVTVSSDPGPLERRATRRTRTLARRGHGPRRDRQHISARGCPSRARTRRPRAHPRQDRAHRRLGTSRLRLQNGRAAEMRPFLLPPVRTLQPLLRRSAAPLR